jgi:phosphatidylserine/phosphatidylglycerophosphate/cardiolipin synthase-like enzyme
LLVVLLAVVGCRGSHHPGPPPLTPPGWLELVESAPVEAGIDQPDIDNTHRVWRAMIDGARERIDLAHFYAANRTGSRLEAVVVALEQAAQRGVVVRFLADATFAARYPATLARIERFGHVRRLVTDGRMEGVLHAKYMVVDRRELYLGSANFDWRALEHIAELGVRLQQADLSRSLAALFEHDWQLAGGAEATRRASDWHVHPVPLAQPAGRVRLVASPPGWLLDERSWDLPALIAWIDAARERVRIQLLNFKAKHRDGRPFVALENALARAAARGVQVELLVSHWSQSKGTIEGLQRLVRDTGASVYLMTVPPHSQGFIPFARVTHSKYMVVDGERAWIGTSNWAGDYFYKGRNVGVLIDSPALAARLDRLFTTMLESGHSAPLHPTRRYPAPRVAK